MPTPDFGAIEAFLSYAWGGGDGIIRGPGTEAATVQTTPASLSVQVGAFKAFVSKRTIEQPLAANAAAIVAPTGGSAGDLRRIDLVQWTYGVGLNVKAGTESGSPTAPDLDADSIPIAHLYLRKGMSSIKTADDSTNGYIVDQRVFR